MFPRQQRIADAAEIRLITRSGKRVARKFVVLHILQTDSDALPQFGFITSKALGNAVIRNRTKRRLREATRYLPVQNGLKIIVRALPNAAIVSYGDLKTDLKIAFDRGGFSQ